MCALVYHCKEDDDIAGQPQISRMMTTATMRDRRLLADHMAVCTPQPLPMVSNSGSESVPQHPAMPHAHQLTTTATSRDRRLLEQHKEVCTPMPMSPLPYTNPSSNMSVPPALNRNMTKSASFNSETMEDQPEVWAVSPTGTSRDRRLLQEHRALCTPTVSKSSFGRESVSVSSLV